jgi:hypothetical protein
LARPHAAIPTIRASAQLAAAFLERVAALQSEHWLAVVGALHWAA